MVALRLLRLHYQRFCNINPQNTFVQDTFTMDLKDLSILLAKQTTLPDRAVFLVKRDPSLIPCLQIDPGLPFSAFLGVEHELSYQQLLAKTSVNLEYLKKLRAKDNPSISEFFLINKSITLESKIRLLHEPMAYYFSPATIYLFISEYFNKLNNNHLDFLSTLLNSVSHADDFIHNYKYILQKNSIEDVSTFFFALDFLTPRVHERALKELVNCTSTKGFTIEREYFLSLYQALNYKKTFILENASPTLARLLPATFLPLESYQHLSLNQSKKETPLVIYQFFIQFLDSLTVAPVELYEVLQLATFWEGSFKELLELRALL